MKCLYSETEKLREMSKNIYLFLLSSDFWSVDQFGKLFLCEEKAKVTCKTLCVTGAVTWIWLGSWDQSSGYDCPVLQVAGDWGASRGELSCRKLAWKGCHWVAMHCFHKQNNSHAEKLSVWVLVTQFNNQEHGQNRTKGNFIRQPS